MFKDVDITASMGVSLSAHPGPEIKPAGRGYQSSGGSIPPKFLVNSLPASRQSNINRTASN